MSFAFVGEAIPLSLVLADYAAGYYPQARIYSGSALVDTIPLAFISTGYYYATWTVSTAGRFTVVYDVFVDSDHLILSDRYEPDTEELQAFPGPVAEEQGAIRQAFTLDTTSNSIIINLWVELDGSQVSSGLSNAALTLYKHDGTVIATPIAQVAPILHGVFRFVITPIPNFPLGENATFSRATVDFAGPPARTFFGVTGVTFSRSS